MLKIFELQHPNDEKEWICANTNIEALYYYITITDCDFLDLTDAQIIELPTEKWKEHFVKEEDEEESISFEEWMKQNGNSPDIIAGTMYDFDDKINFN